MPEIAMRAESLGKRYSIREAGQATTLAESLTAIPRALGGIVRGRSVRRPREIVWALRDASFELETGTILGVVGRNGAGKTTLLKLLSRVTEPTTGRAIVYGRLGSLLEVGTGLHAELTGRENVFLSGAVMGMRHREIKQRFDEIVEFAGIGRFIDTPIKRYSSGMQTRLSFSVAAHLDPDVFLIDEVLAVGDAAFQQKCLGKLRDVTGEGRTIVFVSHNMGAIKALCDRAILLEDGRITLDAGVEEVVTRYLASDVKVESGGEIPEATPRRGTGQARFTRAELLDEEGAPLYRALLDQPVTVAVELAVARAFEGAAVEVGISTLDGVRCATTFSIDGGLPPLRLDEGTHRLEVELRHRLLPGQYALDLAVYHSDGISVQYYVDELERILDFEVQNVSASGADTYPHPTVRGFVRPEARWGPARRVGDREAAGAIR